MKGNFINASVKKLIACVLVSVLVFSCTFTATPTAFATSAENPEISKTPELRKGSLFLKANVPDDFYDVVCVTLKDKSTEKELTLKVEGGTVFEVYINLPDGKYEVVSAFVEKSDQYSVTFDNSEITTGADLSPSILLDVRPKTESEEDVSMLEPIISDTSSDTTEQSEDTSTSTDSVPTDTPSKTDISETDTSSVDLSNVEKNEEAVDEVLSSKTRETIWDIGLSILAAVVFFVLISFIVFLARNKMSDN